MSFEGSDDHVTDTEPTDTTERTTLLSADRRGSGYDSDGETPTMGEEDENTPERSEQRRTRQTNNDEERQTDQSEEESCGMKYVYKKILNVLPAFGDDDEEPDSQANEEALRFGAQQMILLVFPVFVCMALVVLIQLSIEQSVPSTGGQLLYTPISEDSTTNGGLIFLIALGNVAIFIVLVIIMTIVLVCLYKYRCYLIIQIWLMVASAILLFFFSSFFFVEVLQVHNLPIDWLSFLFIIWNFGATGVLSIHWKGPLRLQQGYLIFCSVLTANIFIKYLPDWTAWLLLFAISVYDLVAVLCPKGPLRVLVETAKERNESIFPSLIYSTTMIWIVGMADKGSPSNNGNKKKSGQQNGDKASDDENEHDTDSETDMQGARDLAAMQSSVPPDEVRQGRRRRPARTEGESGDAESGRQGEQQNEEEEVEERQGFRLGLGDFIFYSVLVGKAAHDSTGDWVVISSCFVAILIGLCMTTLILGIVRRALPALPISIFCGLIFYFTSQYLLAPFAIVLSTTQTFI